MSAKVLYKIVWQKAELSNGSLVAIGPRGRVWLLGVPSTLQGPKHVPTLPIG